VTEVVTMMPRAENKLYVSETGSSSVVFFWCGELPFIGNYASK